MRGMEDSGVMVSSQIEAVENDFNEVFIYLFYLCVCIK